MLLSKALRMQQDLEDKKNEIIIEGLESKIKDCEASLEKKDFLLQATEGSLVELQAENARLNEELLQAQTTLKEKLECFEQEKKELQAKYKAEADKKTKLQESLRDLQESSAQLGPVLKKLPLQLKIYQIPSSTLKMKLMHSMK
jgi:chromosome segregation ATPase